MSDKSTKAPKLRRAFTGREHGSSIVGMLKHPSKADLADLLKPSTAIERKSAVIPMRRSRRVGSSVMDSSMVSTRDSKKELVRVLSTTNIYARDSVTRPTLRGNQLAVLFTGGAKLGKTGTLSFHEKKSNMLHNALSSMKQRYVVLEDGYICLFEVNVASKMKGSDWQNCAEHASLVINVADIKDIKYDTADSKSFELLVRRTNTEGDKKNSSGSFSSSESTLKKNRRLSAQEHRYVIKASSASACDEWVQSILFEARNQALFVSRSADFLEENKGDNLDNLESILRQAVDLWILARGKTADETLVAMEKLIEFMSAHGDKEELQVWQDIFEVLHEYSGAAMGKITRLHELQAVNVDEYHCENGKGQGFTLLQECEYKANEALEDFRRLSNNIQEEKASGIDDTRKSQKGHLSKAKLRRGSEMSQFFSAFRLEKKTSLDNRENRRVEV